MASASDHPPFSEAALLIAISFGWFIFGSILSVIYGFPSSGSFSDVALMETMMLELVLGALALAFLGARGYRISDVLPSPSWRGLQEGLLLYAAAAAACLVVGWLVPSRSDLVQPIAQMLTNAKPSLVVVLLVSMLNGLYEETFLLGYLTRRFATLGASLAVGLSVLVRLLYHLYQGPSGAVSVVVFGIVLGAVYWRTRRLWPAVVAHSVADLVGLAFWTGA